MDEAIGDKEQGSFSDFTQSRETSGGYNGLHTAY